MLYKILSRLFRNNDLEWRYTPRPQHVFFYPLLLMSVGVVTYMQNGWILFGIFCFAFGAGLGVTIILGMNWDKAIEYWDTINKVTNTMMNIKDPAIRNEIWKSMGYNFVPTNIQITERKTDEKGNFTGFVFHKPNISPAIMQMIANKVLMSGDLNFKEEEYSSIVKSFRKVQKDFKQKEIIKQNHIRNPRLSYSFTKKGIDMLYQFASEGVKLELERRKENK